MTTGLTPISAYNVKTITNRDGLTNSSVLSICKGQNDLMLFGTCDGVCYYDGTRAHPINSQLRKGVSVSGPVVEDIATGADDLVWILTNHGLTGLRRNSMMKFFAEFGGRTQRVKCNDQGDTFIITDDTLHSSRGTEMTFSRTPIPGIMQNQLCDYVPEGNHLFIFKKDGIVRYPLQATAEGYNLGKPLTIQQIGIAHAFNCKQAEYIVDTDGKLWIYNLNNDGLNFVADLSREISRRGPLTGIQPFKGDIILGFEVNGLMRLTPQGDVYKLTDFGFNVGIMTVELDPTGDIIWIGTDGQGVIAFFNSPLTMRSITGSQLHLNQNKPIRSILLDDNQRLWIGTKGDGLLSIPDFSMNQIRYPNVSIHNTANSHLSGNNIFAMLQSRQHKGFFIGTEGGIDFYSTADNTFSHVETEPIEWACAMAESADTLWIATQGMGVYRGIVSGQAPHLKLTNVKRFLLDGGQKSSNYFYSIAIGQDGLIYLGNRGKGLFIVDNDQLRYVAPEIDRQSLNLNDIFAILPTSKGVWVGTGGGLNYRSNEGKQRFYDMENNLTSSTIHALTEDANGNVWASTNMGLTFFPKGGTDFYSFSGSNMEVLEYCDGASFSRGNLVAFGGINGVMLFHYNDSTTTSLQDFKAEITSINILGHPARFDEYVKTVNHKNTVMLSHKENSFQLTLGTCSLPQEWNCIFFYSLKGKNSWIDNGESTVLNFSNLAPGNYTLYVKYRDIITGEESPVMTHRIIISPPWYLTWWATLLFLAFLVAFAYMVYRRWRRHYIERKQIMQKEQEQIQRDEIFDKKMNFLTNLVHELNTPLTLVYGPCERMLNYEGSDCIVQRYTKMIMQNMGRLNFLIQEIIDYRRINVGELNVSIEPIAVSEWANDVFDAFIDIAENNQIIYEKDIQPDLIRNLDLRDMIRIFSNLTSNAFKYTSRGGNIRVRLWNEDDDKMLCYSVYNTGKGIAEKDRKRIFDEYTVLDNVDESETIGLTTRNGLGMSICYKAVKRMKGEISIDSVEGKYAMFIVRIPWHELPQGVDEQQVRAPLSIRVTGETPDSIQTENETNNTIVTASAKPKSSHYRNREDAPVILAVDDNREILSLLEDVMSDEYNVLTATSAEQGLELLKNNMPDIIVTDIMMPGLNGLEFTQQLKQNMHTRQIPLIILSAKRSDDERIQGLESGADAYVTKPFSPSYLLATVARLLESRAILKEYYNSSASTFSYQDGKLLNNEERDFRAKVNVVLEKNLSNAEFTPEEMATQLGCSLRNLYRKFSDSGLSTPKDYIKKYRVTEAARQLRTTNLTIQEIIYATGFNTRTLFYQEFRKHYGMTPKEYREKMFVKDESLE